MSRTERRNFRSKPIRDGEHGRKCPSYKCGVCRKVWYRNLLKRVWIKELRNWKEEL